MKNGRVSILQTDLGWELLVNYRGFLWSRIIRDRVDAVQAGVRDGLILEVDRPYFETTDPRFFIVKDLPADPGKLKDLGFVRLGRAASY